MNITADTIKAELDSLQNLDAFSKASNIPRRTLMRIKKPKEGAPKPRHTTLLLIDLALKKHKPPRKEVGKATS